MGRRKESCQGPLAANQPLPQGYTCSSFHPVRPAIVPDWRRGLAGCNAALRACRFPPWCSGTWPLVPVCSGFSIWVWILLRPSAIPSLYLRNFVKVRSKGSLFKTQRWFPISQAPPPPANKHGPRTVFWADESGWETLLSVSGSGSAAEWGAGRKMTQTSWCLHHCDQQQRSFDIVKTFLFLLSRAISFGVPL